MSINVTVSGNPVSIKRGKMVTSDYNNKKEYDKRRLLRLEQVRQQSKELAEDVRNKVRKEKKKQMGEIEREGKEKLKSWQNRKLLELQNQYREALDDIGIGHKEAETIGNESDILKEEKLRNDVKAKNRGKAAETKLQIQKNEENYRKAMPIQHKKMVRDIENTRAALVSCIKNNKNKCQNQKKKQKTSADINITMPNDSDFEEESTTESSGRLPSIQEDDLEDSEGFCECSECSDERNLSEMNPNTAASLTKENYPAHEKTPLENEKLIAPKSLSELTQETQKGESKQKSYQATIEERRKLIEDFRNRPRDVPLDTRISDRIKRRQQMASQPDFCDEIVEPIPVPQVKEITQLRDKIGSHSKYFETIGDVPVKDPLELSSEECICSKFHTTCPCKLKSAGVQTDLGVCNNPGNCDCSHGKRKKSSRGTSEVIRLQSSKIPQQNRKSTEKDQRFENVSSQRIGSRTAGPLADIPSKPSVKLKDVAEQSRTEGLSSAATSGAYRVRHFDFPNRFERDAPSTSHVEKITADSVEVIPNVGSEAEWQEKMRQRDRDAQIRGKRALEKEKIHRDYEEIMKKLPILQRKEHIAQIGTDKPEYHMSEERLKQRERERQNRLENAYAQAVPELRPQIVTLPSRRHEIPRNDEPFEILDGDDSRALNLGKWDTETEPKKMFSAEEVQEIIKAFTIQKPEDRKTKLKQLLRSLKLQKEQLLNEIRALPKDDSINALISDLNSFSDGDDKPIKSHRHKKKDREKEKGERKRSREESDTSNTSSDLGGHASHERKSKSKDHKVKHGRSPSKKMKKSRAKVLVLQNMSTQTTPKATKEKSSTTTSSSDVAVGSQKQVSDSSLFTNVKICSKSHTPCDCNKENEVGSSEEVCKIFIKLNEADSPKIEVVTSARDKGEKSERAEVREVQERSPKSPRKEKERRSKSPSKEHIISRSLEKESTKRVETKSVATETDSFQKPLPKEPKVKLKPTITTVPGTTERRKSPSRKKNESWKEHLSKNSMSTSSTSYLSPPDFSKQNTTASTEASRQSLYNLRKKPQQTNFDRSSDLRIPDKESLEQSVKLVDQKLLNYIQRLLSMSKTSVDELGVSSSEVPTPNQSVIELESNNPLAPLHNIIRFINLRAADLAKELSMSPCDVTPVPPNSVVTTSDGSGSKVQHDESQHLPERDTNGSSSSKTKEMIMSQYADVTDSCSKRIANLAAMIEQLREEKIQMLKSPPLTQRPESPGSTREQSSSHDQRSPCTKDDCNVSRPDQVVTPATSDKDNSTRYYEFPPSGEKSKGSNSTASMDEEELNRRLLEIDMSLAEKLKTFRQNKERSAESSGKSDKSGQDHRMSTPQEDTPDQIDQDFLNRLQRLIDENQEKELPQRKSPELPKSTTQSKDVPFIPLLVDIPKLPILEPQPEGQPLDIPEKRHPPPSKGLITAKKFNGNISLVPHELSTIIEADSQMSTRISPNDSKTCTSPCKDAKLPLSPTFEEYSLPSDKSSKCAASNADRSKNQINETEFNNQSKTPILVSPPKSDDISGKTKSFKSLQSSESSKSVSCNDGTCISLTSSVGSKTFSSSSSSDMASIEAMLRSIGMDWAIPTLHKTQEALALTSTSSSGVLSSRRRSRTKSNSSSEVSLKDFLKKQMMSKISSSSLNKSDASPASFLQEFSEISAIQANSSAEKGKQRTSTPLLTSKSTSKSKEEQQLFTGASDISSVRNSSCDAACRKSLEKQTFHTLGGEEESSNTKSSVE